MSASIREVARLTGLSAATVSLALRGIGKVSPKTRERVRAVAGELGYQPDPILSRALSLARQSKRYRETLAFITEWKTEVGPESQKLLHAGALEQASKMGYGLELFTVSGNRSAHARLSRVLHTRGIRGLIIVPRLGSIQPRLYFNWQHFAPVEITRTLWHPRNLHRVDSNEFHNVIEALHLLKKVGYRRIGMAVEPDQNKIHNGIFYAAFLHSQLRQPARGRVPIFDPMGPWTEPHFGQWLEHHKPDVLFIHRVKKIGEWLGNLNLKVPDDLSVFCINVQDAYWSGLRRDYHGMGQAAVEMASLLLERGEFGLPEKPRCLQVNEFWEPGLTLSRPIANSISRGILKPTQRR